MEYKDYYQILGLKRDATQEQIKKAFRKKARQYHPDVSKEANAEALMKEVNEANAVLSDPEKRAAYDRLGSTGYDGRDFRPPPGWDEGFEFSGEGMNDAQAADFSDFFAELFGGRMRAGGSRARHARRGEDHHAKIALDLEDAYRGANRTLTLRIPRVDANGRVALAEHTVAVQIPAGVYEGQMIRLAGQGGAAPGGQAGDLYLEVHFHEHPRYRVEGRDVYATLPVAPWEAALGANVKAPLPTGIVEIHIPEGSQSGRKLRLKGKGIPGPTPGNLYLVLELTLPPASDPKARKFYEAMAKELAFNPRQSLGV
ncbi:MAG TPA: DnaJ C-terminal domain-containing protein [Burkholderiaceae bacterium]